MIGLRSKRIVTDTLIYVLLTVMVVIWLFPLIWMILKGFDYTGSRSTIFPTKLTMEHFQNLFTDSSQPYGQWLINTLIVATASCIISTLLVLMVSYALSRLRFKSRKKLMNIALILGMFPGFLSVVALFYIFQSLGLLGKNSPFGGLMGLTLAYSLAAGTGYYIVKGFFDTIPMAIDEAARIDGATKNRIFWQMIIPLSKPIIIYTIITNFIGPWCDFILAKTFMNASGAQYYTVAVGIREWIGNRDLLNGNGMFFNRFCAGGVLIAIPITILYLIMQKFYVEGITGGAAKG